MKYIALDLGAESGRVMLGDLSGDRLYIREAHRFGSAPVRLPDGLHIDVLHIWSELKKGIALAARGAGSGLAGIGVDTWGVDFALLDRRGALLGIPLHYRDSLGGEEMERAFEAMPREEMYRQTGLQFMPINTLFRLLRMRLRGDRALEAADRLLMMPDLFNYWLCGIAANELTIGTTSQCYNPSEADWAWELLGRLGIPRKLFGALSGPGTVYGALLPEVAAEAGLDPAVKVIAPGCHDTALAVAAVPARGGDFAYISCGTWSLLGMELPSPRITGASFAANFSNEGGVGGSFRFQKSLTGLWILQECRRAWRGEGDEATYDELCGAAASAPPLRCFIDPEYADFARPGDMPEKIARYCAAGGQYLPEDRGSIVRCVLESLALSFRRALEDLERVAGRRAATVHIVGGGANSGLLCRFAADAMRRRVLAGPAEATAIGNICMQAVALGQLGSLGEARELVRGSFEPREYLPSQDDAWEGAYRRFAALAAGSAGASS